MFSKSFIHNGIIHEIYFISVKDPTMHTQNMNVSVLTKRRNWQINLVIVKKYLEAYYNEFF